jgi:glutaredoxin 3
MAAERVKKLASQHAVVIFGGSNCCMCHTVQTLFTQLGVSWAVHELDKDPQRKEVERVLAAMVVPTRSAPVPAVFIGGALVGTTDRVMSLHIGGQLVPLLRQAGALWL